jgi:outer membrane immunogenic protein
MKIRYGLTVAAAIAVSAAAPAVAQTQPVSIPAKDFGPVWTGFYVGAAFGAGGAVNTLNSSGGGLATSFNGVGGSGVLGSIYGGVDYQITPRGVLGLLAELTYSGFQGSASAQVPGATANVNMNTGLGWAALARAGVLANPSTLLYLVGGYAGQNIQPSGRALRPG